MKLSLFGLLLAVSMNVFSNTNMEGEACSQITKVCANYHTDVPFTTAQENRFKLVLTSSDGKAVSFLKADLWMQMGGHGHGSSPLKITQLGPQEFDITKAYFVMKGSWQVRVTYSQDGQQEMLIIPVTITQ